MSDWQRAEPDTTGAWGAAGQPDLPGAIGGHRPGVDWQAAEPDTSEEPAFTGGAIGGHRAQTDESEADETDSDEDTTGETMGFSSEDLDAAGEGLKEYE